MARKYNDEKALLAGLALVGAVVAQTTLFNAEPILLTLFGQVGFFAPVLAIYAAILVLIYQYAVWRMVVLLLALASASGLFHIYAGADQGGTVGVLVIKILSRHAENPLHYKIWLWASLAVSLSVVLRIRWILLVQQISRYVGTHIKPRLAKYNRPEDEVAIEQTLRAHNITGAIADVQRGDSFTRYDLALKSGEKSACLQPIAPEIARSLKAGNIRIIPSEKGKGTVGIEVANNTPNIVTLGSLLLEDGFFKNRTLPLAIGRNAEGKAVISDLVRLPHLLIGGTPGSGKSTALHTLILSVLACKSPKHVRIVLIDPKEMEFSIYRDIDHLLVPVATESDESEGVLKGLVDEMHKRQRLLTSQGVRVLADYNQGAKSSGYAPLPYIVVIIDELADLILFPAQQSKSIEGYLLRLLQKARAMGIHLILATQRPDSKVVTGTLKAVCPARLAFSMQSKIDSRTILDISGAETLESPGDGLFSIPGQPPIRIKAPLVTDTQIAAVAARMSGRHGQEAA